MNKAIWFFPALLMLISCAHKSVGQYEILLTQAKHRSVIVKDDKYCLEPPPSVSQDMAMRIESEIQAQKFGKAGGIFSDSTFNKPNYSLSESNLLLQYALYRLCEMQLNGVQPKDDLFLAYQNIIDKIINLTATIHADAQKALLLEQIQNERIRAAVAEHKDTISQNIIRELKTKLGETEKSLERLAATGDATTKPKIEESLRTISSLQQKIADFNNKNEMLDINYNKYVKSRRDLDLVDENVERRIKEINAIPK
jgi:hypothetical protein